MTATTVANPLLQLKAHGQSVWLDNLTRSLIQSGKLERLIREDGLCGITSNPTIFHKAITQGDEYRAPIERLARSAAPAQLIYETLAIEDIRGAAGVLRRVFDETGGSDGFVSLEVSPLLARDTQGTIQEATRLWHEVDRPNVFIKIPGTTEGLPAIESCLAKGVNINITLLFSVEVYKQVMEAHLRALEARLRLGQPLAPVASVASFFLSRIDTMVDQKLDKASELRGRAAIANAKLAYQAWKQVYSGPRWERLRSAGAHVQRPLWASTSTKDPAYPDVNYVEPLIGRDTVNTMPEETMDAFRDHGRVADTLELGIDQAREDLRRLAASGIDMVRVTDRLVEEGIEKFNKPFAALLKSIEDKVPQAR